MINLCKYLDYDNVPFLPELDITSKIFPRDLIHLQSQENLR